MDERRQTNAELLSLSTVRIECDTPDGISTGTGFFFGFFKDEKVHTPVIVTNRHVVEGATSGQMRLNLETPSGPPLNHKNVAVSNLDLGWIMHPDPHVDLCVYPMAPLLNSAKESGIQFTYSMFDRSTLISQDEIDDLIGLDEVTMVGYPNGLWDSFNNMPIMRRGVAATHPKLDYEGRKEFLIDVACFPGSSGSPVLIYNSGLRMDRAGNIRAGNRIRLIGILYAGPLQAATGEIEMMALPISPRPVAVTYLPINLGQVIKAERLLEFEPAVRKWLDGLKPGEFVFPRTKP